MQDELETSPPAPLDLEISWTASEYIAHHKTMQWFVKLGVVAVIAAIIIWFFTKDEISAAVVIGGAVVLGVYAARPPQELQYSLTTDALTIGPKLYQLAEFRSFSIDDQQAFSSVNLLPLKRFAPGLTIYFAPDDESTIIDILASVLPMEEHRLDLVDRLMHRIRF